MLKILFDVFLHLDRRLADFTLQYGSWIYGLLWLVVFCETGLVFLPFLPGDSLLFAAGALAALGSLHVGWVWGLLILAAVLGDGINYWIGRTVGLRAFERAKGRFVRQRHLDAARSFYDKHGSRTIVLARFIPIIRTLAPFVAGLSDMSYAKFFAYNIIGGLAWVSLLVGTGYFFGSIPMVKQNFSSVILVIITLSFLPVLIESRRARDNRDKG